MTVTAVASTRPDRTYEGFAFHALMLGFIIATQILFTPVHDVGPDNTWHYRFAREIVSGGPVYWAGIDGNRLFPDLVFAIVAYIASGASLFAGYLYAFFLVFFVALYLSLIALAATLYEDVLERRAFVLISLVALWGFVVFTEFWGRWYVAPGNHGTGLPVVFACLALVFWMYKRGRFSMPAAFAFVLAASFLVGSNRFLLLGFLGPLLLALGIVLATKWAMIHHGPAHGPAPGAASDPRLWPLPALIAMVGIAVVGSYVAYRLLSDLSWHKSVTYMEVQALKHKFSLTWAVQKLGKEIQDFVRYFYELTRDVAIGPLVILATLPAAAILFVRAVRNNRVLTRDENLAAFGIFTACSAVLSVAFVIWAWDENNEWKYRYLAMANAYAIVFLSTFLVRPGVVFERRGVLATTMVAAVVAFTAVHASRHTSWRMPQERQFQRQVERLTEVVSKHTTGTPPKGVAEYWLAIDISSRTNLRVDVLEHNKPQLRFYNNNSGSVCSGDYSFLLRPVQRNEPKRSEIIPVLGEPTRIEDVEILGHGKVEVWFYDPKLLASRLVEPGKKAAAGLFPNFRCPD